MLEEFKKEMGEKPTLEIQKRVTRELVSYKIYEMIRDRFGSVEEAQVMIPIEVGYTKRSLSRWLSGKSSLTLDTLTRAAYLAGKTPKITFEDL